MTLSKNEDHNSPDKGKRKQHRKRNLEAKSSVENACKWVSQILTDTGADNIHENVTGQVLNINKDHVSAERATCPQITHH